MFNSLFAGHNERVSALRSRYLTPALIALLATLLIDLAAIIFLPEVVAAKLFTKAILILVILSLMYLNSTKENYPLFALWSLNLVIHVVNILCLIFHFSFYISLGVSLGALVIILLAGFYMLFKLLRR